jgi:hypothetical protein
MLKRLGVFIFVITAVILTVIGLAAAAPQASPIVAQSTLVPLPPAPDGSTPVPNEAKAAIFGLTAQARHDLGATQIAPFLARTLWDYRIVYLIAEGAVGADNQFNPENLWKYGNITAAYTWDSLISLNASQPVEAVIIHESAKDMVDTTWLQAAYHNGVVMAGVNMFFNDLGTLIGNNCEYPGVANPHTTDHFVVYSYVLFPDREEDRAAINAGVFGACKDPDLGFRYHYGVSQNEAGTSEEFEGFLASVRGHLVTVDAKTALNAERSKE